MIDRQGMQLNLFDIRLWGEGQILICRSKVICFGADASACETLKNLTLAGIGYITLVDDTIINEQDLRENFFINKDDIGKNRAEVAMANLLELNPDVQGMFFPMSAEQFLEENLEYMEMIDIIVACNKQDKLNHKLIEIAEKFCKRVVIVRNFGLINYLRIYENFHANMQLKLPESPVIDLRLANPWDELKEFCREINLPELEEIKHKHMPYIVLLLQALENYKLTHNENNPRTGPEKTEFKNLLKSMKIYEEEENFTEALDYYYYVNQDKLNLVTANLSEIFKLIETCSLENLIRKSNTIMSIFFVTCRAMMIFLERYNTLPLVGNIPDMTSDTETYIALKRIYEKKGKDDREEVKKIICELLSRLPDIEFSSKKEEIAKELEGEINFVDIICKNWPQISISRYSSIAEENIGAHFKENDFDEPNNVLNFIWYLLIKSADSFYDVYGRYPGSVTDFQSDIPILKKILDEYITSKNENMPIDPSLITEEHLFEFCRMSNSIIVPTVSMIGSMASQEIIKLITYQFTTMESTVIFNGIHSTISGFKV